MSDGGWIPTGPGGKLRKVGGTTFNAYIVGYEKGRASVKHKRKATTKRRR